MKTDVIVVSSSGSQMEEAFAQAEKVAAYKGLSRKSALHLRLLTEEMMGMMRSITGETQGEFWIEDKDNVYQLHLRVNAFIDPNMRAQLIAASFSGKNEASRGIMGKIRAFFEPADEGPSFPAPFLPGGATEMYGTMEWSMDDYRRQLEQFLQQQKEGAEEAWDELEKSVVSHVADDVKVSIKGREAELIIIKRMN